MSEQSQPPTGADPLAGAVQTPPPAPGADAPAAPVGDGATADQMRQVLELMRAQQEEIAALRADLDARIAAAAIAPSAATRSNDPIPAGHATGAPGHVMATALDADPGNPIVRYVVPSANGGDPLTGYGLVIHVDTIDDGDGASHAEYVVARLDVLGVRLRAEYVVDEDASAAVQARLDARNAA